MEEEPTSIPFVSTGIKNSNIGISNYDYMYRTYRCCYCNEHIVYTEETQKIMIDKLEKEHLRVHNNLPRDVILKIKNYVDVEKAGLKISHSQHIHFACYTIIHNPSNHALLHLIQQKAHIELPNPGNANIQPIPKYSFHSDYPCIYCNTQLTEQAPGFCYNLVTSIDKIRYLHITCYGKLKDKEVGVDNISPQQEAASSSSLLEIIDNAKLPQNPAEWTKDTITFVLNQWRELLHQFKQPMENIEELYKTLLIIGLSFTSKELDAQGRLLFTEILFNDEVKNIFSLPADDFKPELERLKKRLDEEEYPKMSIEDRRKITYLYNMLQFRSLDKSEIDKQHEEKLKEMDEQRKKNM